MVPMRDGIKLATDIYRPADKNGIPIKVTETQEDSLGVDCPKDIEKVQQLMNESVSG